MIPHLLRPAAAALALVALGTASAQVSPSAASATPPPAGSPADVAPAPAPTFTSGGDLRLRNEYLNNAFSLSAVAARHEQDYFRFRGRLWFADAFAPGFAATSALPLSTIASTEIPYFFIKALYSPDSVKRSWMPMFAA